MCALMIMVRCSYADKDENMRFRPTSLGEALVSAYQKMNLEGLWRPNLRGRIEQGISSVAIGQQPKHTVLQEACQLFRQVCAVLYIPV